ncbi:MAG: MATE family efflux transporter [Spirochaetes bacterium]|nr:MATE family efflux transporter [Spirochaetota bacterium]
MIKKIKFIYDKDLFNKIVKLSLPIMVTNFIQTLYNLTDTYFLGKVGVNELTAPAISMNILFFFIVFGNSFSLSAVTLISQAKGQKDYNKVNFYLGQSIIIIMSLSFIIMLIGIISLEGILKLLYVPKESFQFTYIYMFIMLLSFPFMFFVFIYNAAVNAVGDTVASLWIQIITVIINVILDPILIFGMFGLKKMGVMGAAIATLFARAIAAFYCLFILLKGKYELKINKKYIYYDINCIKTFFEIGMPSAIGQGLSSLGFNVLQGVVNYFGTPTIAAFGIGNRIISIFNMPAQGISRALTTLVGQSIGENNLNKAKKSIKYSIIFSLLFLVPTMTLTFFFGEYFIKFFVNNKETMELGHIMFKIISPSVVFFGLFTTINGAFHGTGKTRPVMFLNILRLWGLRVPLAYILALNFKMGPLGIWISMFISNMVTSLIGFYLLKIKDWKKVIKA